MIVEEGPDGQVQYIIHQSWLGDWLMCGRRGVWSADTKTGPSEATAIGTAMHEGFEAYLRGVAGEDCLDVIGTTLEGEWRHPMFRNVKGTSYMSALQTARACFEAMVEQVYPKLEPAVTLEHKFRHKVDERRFTDASPISELWIEGTWDMDEGEDLRLWDWKTAGREYDQWQVDRYYIQPTMYTLAKAIELGRLDRQYTFSYGIAIKRVKNAKTQILHTDRGPREWAWLIGQMWDAVESYVTNAFDNQAPRNDQGWHCSQDWCHFWEQCKGRERKLPNVLLNTTPREGHLQ